MFRILLESICRYEVLSVSPAKPAAYPVRQMLTSRGVREGICAGAEHGDEQRCRFGLACSAVVNGDRGSGPIDEQFLSGSVILPECPQLSLRTETMRCLNESDQKGDPGPLTLVR